MTNYKKESHGDKPPKQSGHIKSAPDTQTPISSTTLQRKVSSKIEIVITRKQLSAITWLFKQYGKPKPGWLRQKFDINQRRRKCLNTELVEAQLDTAFCDHYHDTDEYYDLLHTLWHQINGVPSCK